ncbi:hypothetical protein PAERUG_P62_London_9_VIM_2_01_14_00777 [Pseudomonas aeruginosa]|nr:hypothetical protein PAERUG_P22_London_17_VIM_2_06_10_01261 [Pseudomonas aeruginosa]CRP62599.1 hypothetical protein PAERUG_P2_London_28_IMP_1_06_05_03159 [Pseudomonas aeruginosa]CRQ52520.1 hypothetical protein PAERUG_E15_London_28_01_14_03878 [Pseudomonas aeruginosa]CRR85038.1 hypothetical protein PAERUG_P48_London_17_VIM_2_01_13_02408 [Pseudomonas aeruginosa]CRW69692.1 hypothetical protein PAERUG_P62_London_9_VIM_2_01_14_00777 [Pseudomonas aeruginosa]
MHRGGELGLARIGLVGAAEHVGVDHRRTHGVDADALLRVLDRRRFGQADHRVLGSSVDAHLRRRAEPGDRGGVDDRATALGQHQRDLVLHAQPDALHVDSHDGVELGFVAVGQLALLDLDTGVVEGIVETAVGRCATLYQRLDLGVAGDVAANEEGFASRLADRLDRALAAGAVQVGDHHLDPGGGEGQRGSPADARRTASDQCDLAGKKFAHLLLLGKSPSANRDGTGPRQSSQGRRKA